MAVPPESGSRIDREPLAVLVVRSDQRDCGLDCRLGDSRRLEFPPGVTVF